MDAQKNLREIKDLFAEFVSGYRNLSDVSTFQYLISADSTRILHVIQLYRNRKVFIDQPSSSDPSWINRKLLQLFAI